MPAGVYKRTKEHCDNISKAKKGCKQQPQCGFQKGHAQLNTGRTHYKKGNIPFTKGKKRPEMTGENNPNWKGGIAPLNNILRNTPEYRTWRRDVFIRDYWTCQECGHKNIVIRAHHIKSFADYPELRHDITNGITLCLECHKKLTFDYD